MAGVVSPSIVPSHVVSSFPLFVTTLYQLTNNSSSRLVSKKELLPDLSFSLLPWTGNPDNKIEMQSRVEPPSRFPRTVMKHPGSELTIPQLVSALKLKLRRTAEQEAYVLIFFSRIAKLIKIVQGRYPASDWKM